MSYHTAYLIVILKLLFAICFCIPSYVQQQLLSLDCQNFVHYNSLVFLPILGTPLRWYAQSESIIIKTHSKTIVLQDYRFYLLVFFRSLLLFTVPRCKTIFLKHSRIFLLVLL